MQTETKTITQLPIMKYFDDAKLVEKGKETLAKWRKGEKPIASIIGSMALSGSFKASQACLLRGGILWSPPVVPMSIARQRMSAKCTMAASASNLPAWSGW